VADAVGGLAASERLDDDDGRVLARLARPERDLLPAEPAVFVDEAVAVDLHAEPLFLDCEPTAEAKAHI